MGHSRPSYGAYYTGIRVALKPLRSRHRASQGGVLIITGLSFKPLIINRFSRLRLAAVVPKCGLSELYI